MKYTNAGVIAAARAAVEEKGADYVYPRSEMGDACWYGGLDGKPSCIVGNIINRLDPRAFAAVVDWEVNGGESGRVWQALAAASVVGDPIELTKAQADALQSAQDYQDEGHEWGLALRRIEALS